ncbi:MATE family efflux transporter [Spirochaetia bacterium]|nr:MATE family efflux transporter [Spirochaetia bacterium]
METVQGDLGPIDNYLLTEPVKKLLPKFIIPCVISLIISCLYNIVDQIFVGQGIGYLGNAATGIIFPITVIGWAASLLFGDGAAAYLSLAQGSGNTKDLGKTIANSVLFSFLSGVVLILICYLWGDRILYSLGATDATIELTRDYGYIIFIMIPLALAQNTLAGIIRADGSPRYAMGAMAVGAVLNIIFDPITIFVWGWGIKGAASATIFGQFVSFVICAVYLARSKMFRLRVADFIPRLKAVRRVLPLGGSSFLTQISIVIVTVVNNKLLVSYGALSEYGPDIPLAAFVVIMKLFQIVLNIAIGIAAGAQPVIGFNYGAKHYDRVRQAFKYVITWTLLVTAIATLLFEAMPQAFIALFGSDGELYTTFAVRCLRIYLALIIFTCVQKACAIFLQSIGKASAAIPLSIIRDVIFLIVFTFILPVYLGVTGIFWAAPVADILAIIVTVVVVAHIRVH